MVHELLDAAVRHIGGSPRDNQTQMAEAVEHALESERHLAVQAGTGTGKSLAYLVPSIAYAIETGNRVVIATATLALQKQLIARDVPRVVEALSPLLEKEPQFSILKGRNNYVCKRKTQAQLDPWLSTTKTGDRDEWEGDPDAWSEMSVTSRECIGASRCPFGDECFAEKARQQAHNADIIITNHAMLAIDASSDTEIIPPHNIVIIDEAHELESRITAAATQSLSVNTLYSLAAQLAKAGDNQGEAELVELADLWRIEPLSIGRWTEPNAKDIEFLDRVAAALFSASLRISHNTHDEDVEATAERQVLYNQIIEAHNVLDDHHPEDDVVWVSDDQTYYVAPLSVRDILHDALFTERTTVLTSATLVLGGRFDAMAQSWGIPDNTWDALDVGTPFIPEKSGILYNAAHLPTPGIYGNSEESLEELAQLIQAIGGRTLGLFTSRMAAEKAAEKLRNQLDVPIYCQGEDNLMNLVEKFHKDEESCLFGTLSLWQGVDIPGSSCSLVVMDRIPFPRKDDPLMQARMEKLNFMRVYATHAALLMAQGAGRLLRAIDDKGVVAVLDSRLSTARYGSFLKNSMPPFWFTTDHDVVIQALNRLKNSLED